MNQRFWISKLGAFFTLLASSAVQAELIVLSTSDGTFDAGVFNQGFWTESLDNTDDNTNYLTGRNINGVSYRSFFTFLIPMFEEEVARVSLSVPHASRPNSFPITLAMYDVSTPAEQLNDNDGMSSSIFRDLGTGTRYGEIQINSSNASDESVILDLNDVGIDDLLNAQGNYFSVGLKSVGLSSIADGLPVFGNSGRDSVALVIETVPEPSAMIFIQIALLLCSVGVAWRMYRQS